MQRTVEEPELFMHCHDTSQLSQILQDLTTKGFKWQDQDEHVQHDVHELNRLLIDALERSLANTASGADLIPTLYTGQVGVYSMLQRFA